MYFDKILLDSDDTGLECLLYMYFFTYYFVLLYPFLFLTHETSTKTFFYNLSLWKILWKIFGKRSKTSEKPLLKIYFAAKGLFNLDLTFLEEAANITD